MDKTSTQKRERPEPSPAFITRLLEFTQGKAEEILAQGLQHRPILFFARTNPQTNDPDFEGTSDLALTDPIMIENQKKGDLDVIGPVIKIALESGVADVAVFVAEGWVTECRSEEEARAIQAMGPDSIKTHGKGRSAVVITMYTRDAEYAVVNNIEGEMGTGQTRTMTRGELRWDQEFKGGMSIHKATGQPFSEPGSVEQAREFKGIFRQTVKKPTLH